jgi:PAS domain S-box-containing protein
MSKQHQELALLENVTSGNGSNPPVGKILVIDDEPKLRSVLVESLHKQGFEVVGCGSGSDALAELHERDFDLLLTDLMMPKMDGIALLKSALKIDPHLVGIIMTGQGTIQTAVDAMQIGAFDYVLKPFQVQTLMPVLTRAMNVRHLKLENLQLRETVAIHGLCQTIAFTLDPQTVLSKLADAALQQTDADEVSILLPTSEGTELYVAAVRGKNRERLLGERVSLKDSISSWVARARKPLILNGTVCDERFVALWPRPEIRSAVSVPLQLANKLIGIINLNVTNRLRPFTLGQMKALTILASTAAAALESASLYTQVQQAEKDYHSIFHNAIEGIFRATADHLLTVNPSMAQILGYESPEEVVRSLTNVSTQLFVDPTIAPEFIRTLEERGVLQGCEFEAYRKDGEKIWLSLNMRMVRDEKGKEICREGSVEDITERKRAEAERLVMFEIIQGVSNSADVETLLTLVHQTIQKVVNAENCFVALYDEQTDTLGMQFFVDQHDVAPPPQKLNKSCTAHVFRTGEPLLLNQERFDQLIESGEVELLGESSPSWLGVPLNTPAKTIGVLVVQNYEDDQAYSKRDVDFLSSVGGQIAIAIERKQSAEALGNSEAELRALFAAMTDVIFVLDADGRYLRIAPTDPTYLYEPSTQLLGKTLHDVFPNAEADLFLKHIRRALAEGKAHKVEYYLQINGARVWFDGSVAPMAEESVIWIARDITERKHAEEERDRLTAEIENQRRRLKNMVGSVPGVVWEAWGEPDAPNQRIDFISDYVETMLGYSVSDWTSTPNFWLSIVHPEDREAVAAVAAEGFTSGKGATMEFRWIAKNGREVWVESNFVIVKDETGKHLGMRGVNTDIGERKRAEEALRQSENQLAEAQRLAHIGSWNWDLPKNVWTWSDEHYHIFGIQRGDIEVNFGESVFDFIHPEDRELVRSEVARSLETREPFDFHYRIVRRDGEERIIQSSGNVDTNECGEAIRLFGTAQDVTERSLIERQLRQSEERYRDLVENAHDLIYEHDLQGNYTASNKAGERITGYTLEETLKLNLGLSVAPDYLEKAREMLQRKLAGESVTAYDLVVVAKDGHRVPMEVNTRLVFKDGVPVGVQGIARDITERKRAEEVLRESEERYRLLFESNPQPMWVYDLETLAFLAVNESAVRHYGYSRDDFLAMTIKDIRPVEDLPALYDSVARISEPDEPGVWRHLKKDGVIIYVEVTSHLLVFDDRQAELILAHDITERRQAEEARGESEARRKAILESSMDCIITMDHKGLVVDWNPAAENTFGYSQAETIGRNMADLIIPERYREKHSQGLARYLTSGEGRMLGQRLELSAERRDGTEFPIELTITRIESKGAAMFTGYLRDITDRKKTENRLSAQYAVTRALAESNTIAEGAAKILQAVCESLGWEYGALWIVDSGVNVLRCSQTWQSPLANADKFENASRAAVFGPGTGLPGRVWSNGQPAWIADVVNDENFPRSSEAALAGLHGACGFPIRFRLEILGVVEFFSRTIRDSDPDLLAMMLTIGSQIGQFIERKRVEVALGSSEEQLRQSQKLEAIGQLAGGVAHDFNNLLTVIGGYSSILLGKLPEESPHRSSIEEIKKASDRASALTRQLLAFSRKQILQPKILDLNVVTADLEKMVRRLIGEDIDLLTIPAPGLGKVKADPGQIEQVLLNLIVNARDAMPQGGKITIETRNVVHSAEYARRHATQPGTYVMLAVSDTGQGIHADIQPRIFEPFFTTKGSGKGTGLGLATVYGIVKQSDGNIWVYSEVGRGSTFKIYLPRVDDAGEEAAAVALTAVPQGTELILLVEDEDQVRAILKQILEGQGYQVLAASNGAEALSLSEELELDIKLIITDVVMPQMSGRELAERVLELRPNIPVLFMSGYTDDAIVRHGLLDEKLNFIQKPFDSASVARKVREVLDSQL